MLTKLTLNLMNESLAQVRAAIIRAVIRHPFLTQITILLGGITGICTTGGQ